MSMDMPSGLPVASRSRKPRRELLAAAAGAIGVIAAETVARATPAQAANSDPVLQGSDNGPTTGRTMIFTASDTEFASLADPNTSGKGSVGMYGHGQDIGVLGDSTGTGTGGVRGGVVGKGGGTAAGVVGYASPDNGVGVIGYAVGTDSGTGVAAKGGVKGGMGLEATGTYAVFATSFGTGGIGVVANGDDFGVSAEANGMGVRGIGQDGVVGQTSTGNGVRGLAEPPGVAVSAENTFGIALKATGRTVFNRSGILTIRAGSSKVTKSGVALTRSSLILATLQQNRAGVFIQAAVPDVSANSFTVHLNKAVSKSTTVAWFAVN